MKKDIVYLQHILDAIGKIESYIAVGEKVFMETSSWQDAVIRQLEIVGEAAKKVSKQFREKYPDVPWKEAAGLRDVLIHDYMGVEIDTVWETTQQDLPGLKRKIRQILTLEE